MNYQDQWIQTYTGGVFHPLNPVPDEVRIEDIAHSLSHICRFNGHCKRFYSVADHSLQVCKLLLIMYPHKHNIAMTGLMHDAAEAYIGDLTRPIKSSLFANLGDRVDLNISISSIESHILDAISEAIGFDIKSDHRVKEADDILLATEARDLMADHPIDWELRFPPMDEKIMSPHDPISSEYIFINAFYYLAEKLGLPIAKNNNLQEIRQRIEGVMLSDCRQAH